MLRLQNNQPRECLDAILPTLTDVVNHFLLTGEFPLILKKAIMKPLLKKTSLDPEDLKNYNPVSNLSFMSKVLEKVVLFQILQHVNSTKLLSDFQSAYRPYHSTETALLKVTNDLLSAIEGKISVLVFLDLSAALDTIDHEILLHRLHHVFGFGNTMLTWFQSYFQRIELKLLLYMVNTQLQLLFIMVYHWDQFLDQYILLYTSMKCHQTLSSFKSSVCR